jgi:hypothetical protein
MKKILIYGITCLFATTFQAQETRNSDKAYMERCRKIRESLIETGREFRAQTHVDCKEMENLINEGIEGFKNATTNEDKDGFMHWYVANKTCPQAIDFFKKVILSDPSEFIRSRAMLYLGWTDDAQNGIPFLLDYYRNNPNLSPYEKVLIGGTLIVWEAWDYAEPILNEYCFDTTKSIVRLCMFCHQRLGNESSKKYFRYMNKQFEEEGLYFIWDIVDTGDKEFALPLIKKSLKRDNPNKSIELRLLEKIGDDESINLIKSALDDPHESVRKDAEKILRTINTSNKE